MKFLLENNLSKLAKWLRFLGYDTEVLTSSISPQVLSKNQDRVFITTSRRWERTLRKVNIRYIVVPRHDWELQLCMVIKRLSLSSELRLNLCPECGAKLKSVKKEEFKDRVPPKAYESAYDFTYCPRCDLLLWKGLHYERMKKMLSRALSKCD